MIVTFVVTKVQIELNRVNFVTKSADISKRLDLKLLFIIARMFMP